MTRIGGGRGNREKDMLGNQGYLQSISQSISQGLIHVGCPFIAMLVGWLQVSQSSRGH